MKSNNLQLKIKRYCNKGHWHVFGAGLMDYLMAKSFSRYEDARKYALRYAYARNIKIID